MKRKDKVFLATLIGVLAMAFAAQGTNTIKNQWLSTYPNACAELVAAANSCNLCHGQSFSLNPYAQARLQAGSFAAIENLDSDGDTVSNLNEILACTLPGDPTSVTPTDPLSWSGIKALYR